VPTLSSAVEISPAVQNAAKGIEGFLIMARNNQGEKITAKDLARRTVPVVPPERIEALAKQGRGVAAYYSALGRWSAVQEKKYTRAAGSPWLTVGPDPPPDLYFFVRHE
jgi:hypothetical protein